MDSDVMFDEQLMTEGQEISALNSSGKWTLTWTSFLNFIKGSCIAIISSSDLAPTAKSLGSGQTMAVDEYLWKKPHSGLRKPRLVAVKQSKTEDPLPESNTWNGHPPNEERVLRSFMLELRALAHGSIRNHPNIVGFLPYLNLSRFAKNNSKPYTGPFTWGDLDCGKNASTSCREGLRITSNLD